MKVRAAITGILGGLLLTVPNLLFAAELPYQPGQLRQQFNLPEISEPPPKLPIISQPPAPPPPAVGSNFILQQVRLAGVTVFTDDDLAAIINPYLQQQVVLADLFRLAEELTNLYRARGYVLSRVVVPAQTVSNGVVMLQAIEGSVTALNFTGDADSWVQQSAAQLLQLKPLRLADLQRWLLLVNDAPGLEVTGDLQPDASTPLGAVLTINTKRKNIEYLAGVDRRGTRFVGPWQAYAAAQVNGMFGQGDSLAARFYTSRPDGALRYVQLNHQTALTPSGLRLETTLDYVRSEPGGNLATLNAEGKTDGVAIALTYPLIRQLNENLFVGLKADYNNSQTIIAGAPKLTPSVNDRVRTLSALANYNVSHQYGASSGVRGTVSRGVDIFNASVNNTATPSRSGGSAEFWLGTLELSHKIFLAALKPGASLLLATQLQHSFNHSLLAGEQLAVGGADYGRGFEPAAISGDRGIAAKVELAVPFALSVGRFNLPFEPYGFGDAALVRDEKQRSGIEPERKLFSVGAGVRFSPADNTSGYVELAKQLPASLLADGTRPDGWRFSMGLLWRF